MFDTADMHRIAALCLTLGFAAAAAPSPARAHCQVPCGIYDDHARVHMIREDITTIEKAVANINELAARTDAQSANQLVRWINNKEIHAEKIIRTISDYFMAQKIKPAPKSDKKAHAMYVAKLARHHAVMVAAMKCKQQTSKSAVEALKKAVDGIEGDWPEK